MLFFVLCALQPADARTSRRKLKFCKLDVAFQCGFEVNAMFTATQNGSGIVNSQEDMEQFCFNQVDYVPVCMKQWLAQCANPTYTEIIFKMFVEPMRVRMQEFCDPMQHIRNEFLKYSDCLIHRVKLAPRYRKECIQPLQAAGEWVHKNAVAQKVPNIAQALRATCCAFNKWEQCILGQLTEECTQPSADVFPYLIHHISSDLVKYICSTLRFNHKDPSQCREDEYIPPKNFVAQGLKSTSLMSWVFSFSCPNVGIGIIPERDVF